jgi:hypothetical protein
MSIVPTSFAAGFAGAIAARPAAPEAERVSEATRAHEKEQSAAEESERASGMGEAEGEQATQDRDGDGRQVFDMTSEEKKKPTSTPEPADAPAGAAKDPTGECGNILDLQG